MRERKGERGERRRERARERERAERERVICTEPLSRHGLPSEVQQFRT